MTVSIFRTTFDYKIRGCAVLMSEPSPIEKVPDVIPAEACYLGWQESLILLAKLVEAEISD